ncbi:hypothetical protein [Pontiella sulfatireligans]|uniref:Methyltransferase type 11 domain-containing protein n=1 Tax=Pontiella sulfatireligans TaxID=2750658 RepID=A0A6C2UTK6_9BACT|nr:hypothetical protein [Pontiella sulfatireligans]VGO22246.1 hypothetical protein SCARR_04328 [Pontiella sulfatireligans]
MRGHNGSQRHQPRSPQSGKERTSGRTASIEWICRDIARPLEKTPVPIDIWTDRAVRHLLTAEDDNEGYFKNLVTKLKMGGYALFAEFPPLPAAPGSTTPTS